MNKLSVSIIVLFLAIAIWWFPYSMNKNSEVVVDDVEVDDIVQFKENIKKNEINLNIETQQNDIKHNELYDNLWTKLHDPDLRDALTARQILDASGFNKLSTEQMKSLVNEVIRLLKNKELNADIFMVGFSRKDMQSIKFKNDIKVVEPRQQKADEVLAEATPEQAQTMDDVRQILRGQKIEKSITAAELLKRPEIIALPQHLRNELAKEAIGMIARGELDSSVFLAPEEKINADVDVDEETKRSEVTYEQWQAFDEIQVKLNNTNFNADTSLSQILTSQEYKILPPYLRKKISTAVVAKLEYNRN